MGPFNAAKVTEAVKRIPSFGGTAIGDAMEAGFKALYKTGCTRKYLLCITDGMNTACEPPEAIGNLLHQQTGGEVEIHFVAFDTDHRKFGFLNKINGQQPVPAQDGAQLASRSATSTKNEFSRKRQGGVSKRPEVRDQKSEIRSQRSEVRDQKSEVRSEYSIWRSQMSEWILPLISDF